MIALAGEFAEGLESAIGEFDLPWSVSRLGARAEYRFASRPRTGEGVGRRRGRGVGRPSPPRLLNRGFLATPFHNMALMCPDTDPGDVARHTDAFREVVGALRDSRIVTGRSR